MMKSCFKKEMENSGPMKRVGFNYIEVKEYPIILGDNPSISDGIPVTIGWKPQKTIMLELEYFELYRPDRKPPKEMKLSSEDRTYLVLMSGSTLQEIGRASMAAKKIQNLRAKSFFHKTHWEHLIGTLDNKLNASKMKKHPSVQFTRIPREATTVLSSWANAAA